METMLKDSAIGHRPTLLESSKWISLLEMRGAGHDFTGVNIEYLIDTAFLTDTHDFAATGEAIHFW